MTVITIVTVGYGDFTPYTRFGKIVTIFTTFWGGYLISILIVSVNGIFSLTSFENNAFKKLIKMRSAVACIVAALRVQVQKRK
mmetsp:Transcript_26249/g.26162  ORF Transcript_26249/g.26162 Transcript_26249/m.26162 type:complete len:83 (+) Transcript_26249:986-1234(+)